MAGIPRGQLPDFIVSTGGLADTMANRVDIIDNFMRHVHRHNRVPSLNPECGVVSRRPRPADSFVILRVVVDPRLSLIALSSSFFHPPEIVFPGYVCM
jgi:hypothetical protein